MTRVLLIGDSICMGYSAGPGYRPFVEEALACRGIHTSAMFCSDSGTLLKKCGELAKEGPFDVIHANCGLHDLKRDRQTLAYTTGADEYEQNIEMLFSRLRSYCPRLIWATTTPVCDEWHLRHKPFDRFESDVRRYNVTARASAVANDIAVNDLHDVIVRFGLERAHYEDGVHFNEVGSRLLANAVVDAITG